MKKFFSCMLLLFITMTLFLPAYAAFENPTIVDGAGYLMQSELDELSKGLDKVRKNYNFEVAVYTESDMTSDTAEESADDIYDYKGYGAGEGADGIMLYICSSDREYHFTTHGKGITYFNSRGLKYLESKVIPYLSEDDYYGAFEAYTETSEELLEMASKGTPYNEKHHSGKYIAFVVIALMLLPLIVAYFMMKAKLSKMKTAVENNYAANYIKQGSMNIAVFRDLFLYSRIVKTEKPKPNQSSGTHTSSSGRTHGGSGGSF